MLVPKGHSLPPLHLFGFALQERFSAASKFLFTRKVKTLFFRCKGGRMQTGWAFLHDLGLWELKAGLKSQICLCKPWIRNGSQPRWKHMDLLIPIRRKCLLFHAVIYLLLGSRPTFNNTWNCYMHAYPLLTPIQIYRLQAHATCSGRKWNIAERRKHNYKVVSSFSFYTAI